MPTVDLVLPHHRYAIEIGAGLLPGVGQRVRALAPHRKVGVIADEAVLDPHARIVMDSLRAAGYEPQLARMPRGEAHKTLDTVRDLYDDLFAHALERKSPVLALGGGITGDVAGYVAATFLRGVPFIQCPTTLLAMVDSSVGGKVGVNVPQGKNLIGAFYQPHAVIIDIDTLATLPPRELRCGLAECVKHGVIRDAALFDWVETHLDRILALDRAALIELVERNVRIKAAVVMEDEKEQGVRAHLNFGHTFAHAIEAAMLPHDEGAEHGRYLHGEAVALGMVAATRLAVSLKLCEAGLLDRLTTLLDRIGLPTAAQDLPAPAEMLGWMRQDKKVQDARLRLVLPVIMGEVVVMDGIPDTAILDAWSSLDA